MIVKMTILRLLGLSDDKEKIGVARPEGGSTDVCISLGLLLSLHRRIQYLHRRFNRRKTLASAF